MGLYTVPLSLFAFGLSLVGSDHLYNARWFMGGAALTVAGMLFTLAFI